MTERFAVAYRLVFAYAFVRRESEQNSSLHHRIASAPNFSLCHCGRPSRPGIIHTSIYLPEAVYEALREAAFRERRKIHDIVLEGIELALRKRGWQN